MWWGGEMGLNQNGGVIHTERHSSLWSIKVSVATIFLKDLNTTHCTPPRPSRGGKEWDKGIRGGGHQPHDDCPWDEHLPKQPTASPPTIILDGGDRLIVFVYLLFFLPFILRASGNNSSLRL